MRFDFWIAMKNAFTIMITTKTPTIQIKITITIMEKIVSMIK